MDHGRRNRDKVLSSFAEILFYILECERWRKQIFEAIKSPRYAQRLTQGNSAGRKWLL